MKRIINFLFMVSVVSLIVSFTFSTEMTAFSAESNVGIQFEKSKDNTELTDKPTSDTRFPATGEDSKGQLILIGLGIAILFFTGILIYKKDEENA